MYAVSVCKWMIHFVLLLGVISNTETEGDELLKLTFPTEVRATYWDQN